MEPESCNELLEVIKDDEYLKPYTEVIRQRKIRLDAKCDQLTHDEGGLLQFSESTLFVFKNQKVVIKDWGLLLLMKEYQSENGFQRQKNATLLVISMAGTEEAIQ